MGFSKDTLTTLLSRAVVLVLGVLQSVVVARYLLPEGRGMLGVLMLIPQTMMVLMPLGLEYSFNYNLRRKTYEREYLFGMALTVALSLGVLGYAASLAVGWGAYELLLTGVPFSLFFLASLSVPLRIGQTYWDSLFAGIDRFILRNKMTALRPVVLIVLILIALPLLKWGLVGVLLAMVGANALIYLLSLRLLSREASLRPQFRPKTLKPMLGYGLQVYTASILLFLNNRTCIAILRYFLSYREVGYYVTAITLAEIIWALPESFGIVLFPTIAGADPEQRNRLTMKVCRVTAVVVGLACAALAAIAYPMVYILYGEKFLPAVTPLAIMMPGIFAMALQKVLGSDITGRGHPRYVAVAAGVGVVLNIILNLWMIPIYGIIGAAVASSVTHIIIMLVVLISFLRLSGSTWFDTLIIKGEDIREMIGRVRQLLRLR